MLVSKLILPKDYHNNNKKIITRVKADIQNWQAVKPHYLFTGSVGSGKSYLQDIIFDSVQTSLFNELSSSQAIERCYDFHDVDKMKYNAVLAGTELRIQSLINSIKTVTARELYRYYRANELKIQPVTRIYCLDDIGAEHETPASRDLIIDVITTLYDRFKSGKTLFLIITTNLDSKMLTARYGSRVVDRIYEMCTVMQFANHSFRKDKAEIIKREEK